MPEPQRLPKILRTRVADERRATASRCAGCGHRWDCHWSSKNLCVGSPVCGCSKFDRGEPTPSQFDERHVDSPEPIDRSTR